MKYKDILNDSKRKIGRVFTWITGVLLLISIVCTILFIKLGLWWVFLIFDFVLVILYSLIVMRYATAVSMIGLKKYLESNNEPSFNRTIAERYFLGNLSLKICGYDVQCWVDKHGKISCHAYVSDGVFYQLIEIYEDKVSYAIASTEIEEQDLDDTYWETVFYIDIKVDLTIEEMLMFCYEKFLAKVETSSTVLRQKWIETFAGDLSKKQLKKLSMTGESSYLWMAFNTGAKMSLSGDEAKAAFDAIHNKNALCLFEDNEFSEEVKESETSKDFEQCGELVIVAKDYSWTYVGTHEEPEIGPYFARRE